MTDKQLREWEKLRVGYEEVQMVKSSIEDAYPEAYRLARKFHELYERQAPFFGYITNPNSKEFYPNSNNARLMAYVCYTIVAEELSAQKEELKKKIGGMKIPLTNKWDPNDPSSGKELGYNQALDDVLKELE